MTTATKADRFSFGLWTVGWRAADQMADLRDDLSAYEQFDLDSPGGRGYGFVRLNQLAVDHLLGAR